MVVARRSSSERRPRRWKCPIFLIASTSVVLLSFIGGRTHNRVYSTTSSFLKDHHHDHDRDHHHDGGHFREESVPRLHGKSAPGSATATAEEVDPAHVQASFDFVQARRQNYTAAGLGRNWHLRGIAHLYEHRQVLLVGRHVVAEKRGHLQRHNIRIDNVYQQHHHHHAVLHDSPPLSCDLLTLWVRVRGPEILAGKAQPVWEEDACHWNFEFNISVPGHYKIDAKTLLWNGVNHSITRYCMENEGPVPDAIAKQYPQHAGFKAFKLYQPGHACCNLCTRQVDPPCRYWSSPPHKMIDKANLYDNGCELYFDANATLPYASPLLGDLPNVHWPHDDNDGDDDENDHQSPPRQNNLFRRRRRRRKRHQRRRLQSIEQPQQPQHTQGGRREATAPVHGPPLSRDLSPPAYYLGCGWHQMFTLDFPCLSADLDDSVYLIEDSFVVTEQDTGMAEALAPLPLCNLQSEYDNAQYQLPGRWVKEPWPNETTCPFPFHQITLESQITVHDDLHPHCWHRDNLAQVGLQCYEMNCRFIHDWSRYTTDFREARWMGVWRRYDCDYYEFTNVQLQQCIDTLHIAQFVSAGESVARMIFEYVQRRINHLQLYKGKDRGRTVTLSTLGILHLTSESDGDLEGWVDGLRHDPVKEDDLYFLVSPYFVSSERETHAHLEKMVQFDQLFKSRLGIMKNETDQSSSGLRYLNAFDMSAAMSHEVSGQLDGMHVVGPTAKMIVTKLFHHLCSSVVDGSKV